MFRDPIRMPRRAAGALAKRLLRALALPLHLRTRHARHAPTARGTRAVKPLSLERPLVLVSAVSLLCHCCGAGVASYLSHFRRTPWLLRPVRNFFAAELRGDR